MRLFQIAEQGVTEHDALEPLCRPEACDGAGFAWLALSRGEFERLLQPVQRTLHAWGGSALLDLHLDDLLSDETPAHHDHTSVYDVLMVRALTPHGPGPAAGPPAAPAGPAGGRLRVRAPAALPGLQRIDTRAVGLVVFERVLLSVHPEGDSTRDDFAARLLAANPPAADAGARAAAAAHDASAPPPAHSPGTPGTTGTPDGPAPAPALDPLGTSARLPVGPADLALRLVDQMVDGYLELRRDLTGQLGRWQARLLNPRSRFNDWGALMQARPALHQLEDICDDQRAAVRDWMSALEALRPAQGAERLRERELLLVRGRDVVEHIGRVVRHVRRLEQNAETAVQMHFSAQGHRANDIMRVLTVLTAVFLPLNLIAGIFGMNFEVLPLVRQADGFWIAMGAMALTALALVVVFWRKRYLERVAS